MPISTFQDVLVGVESGVHEAPGVAMWVKFRNDSAQTLVEQEETGYLKKKCQDKWLCEIVSGSALPQGNTFSAHRESPSRVCPSPIFRRPSERSRGQHRLWREGIPRWRWESSWAENVRTKCKFINLNNYGYEGNLGTELFNRLLWPAKLRLTALQVQNTGASGCEKAVSQQRKTT